MFNKEETQVLLAFLERVNCNGKEADTLVYLKNKLRASLQDDKHEEAGGKEGKDVQRVSKRSSK